MHGNIENTRFTSACGRSSSQINDTLNSLDEGKEKNWSEE